MLTHRPGQGSGPRRRRSTAPLAGAVATALLIAGCGGSDEPAATTARTTAQTPVQTTAETARGPCPQLVAGAVARLDERAPDVLTCTYLRRGVPLVRVTLDRAPQASFRFERTVVERSQAHLGDDAAQLPQEVAGIGRGADWIAAPRILLATDDRTLVTVAVLSPPRRPAADRATAIAVASVALRG